MAKKVSLAMHRRDKEILARLAQEGATFRSIAKEMGLTVGIVAGVRWRSRAKSPLHRVPINDKAVSKLLKRLESLVRRSQALGDERAQLMKQLLDNAAEQKTIHETMERINRALHKNSEDVVAAKVSR